MDFNCHVVQKQIKSGKRGPKWGHTTPKYSRTLWSFNIPIGQY